MTNLLSGCTNSDGIEVIANTTLPIATANVIGQLDCNTLSVSLDGSGSAIGANIGYLWTTATGNILSGATTLSPVVDAPGVYELLVSDLLNGCSATASSTRSSRTGA